MCVRKFCLRGYGFVTLETITRSIDTFNLLEGMVIAKASSNIVYGSGKLTCFQGYLGDVV